MAKKTKFFDFTYTLQRSEARGLKIVTQTLDLQCAAKATYHGRPVHDEESYTADLISVVYDGCEISELLYVLNVMDAIETEAIALAMEIFSDAKTAA